ncbi:MAG: fibronectin type III domain-containing protein [Lachnospiraceae bacterium]|nr:fibronectin type III domain-containing protein [Lachnospiraceae bacterium]MDE6251661.1 fibronectin type III domain-containing protein [Lachnospiraceae bacterium]
MRKKFNIMIFILAILSAALTIWCKDEVQASTDLSKPTNVKAYNPKPDTILVKWDKVSGADGYYVYYSTNSSNGFRIINVEKTNSVVITGLTSRTNYYFKVKSYNNIGVISENSATVSARSSTFGIDVSYHNGDIDWNRVKSNIDYAILRVGYGNNLDSQDDKKWFYNANECQRLGIPFGVYIYSYAMNTAEAESEADHVLRLINGYKLTYPVYYDLEDARTTGLLSAQEKGNLAQAFCSRIQGAGYKVGIYANTYWFTNLLTDSRFSAWEKWVAQYNSECTYKGTYKMWQFSSDGYVDGVNGRVDVNYKLTGTNQDLSNKHWMDVRSQSIELLSPQNVKVEATSSNSTKVTWSNVTGATRYIVYRRREGDSKFSRVAVTIGAEFHDTNLIDGSTYYYKICSYTGDDKVAYFSQFSSQKKVDLYIEMPKNIKAQQLSKSSIKLSWTAVSNATGYNIYRYDPAIRKYKKIATSKKNSYVDTNNVQTGIVYKYRLAATKKTSIGTVSSKITEEKSGIAGPAKVSGFVSDNKQSGVIKLTWNKTAGAHQYEIYVSETKNGKYKRMHVADSKKVSYTTNNLERGKRYYFKIRSVRTEGGLTLRSTFARPVSKVVR